MNRLAVLVSAILFSVFPGCLAQQIDAGANAKAADVHATSETFSPTCDDGALVESHCGLVTALADTDESRAAFRTKSCANMSDDVCDTAYRREVATELAARYPHANASRIDAFCTENSARCEDAGDRERLLIDAENKAARARDANAAREVEADRANEHAIDRANARAAKEMVVTTLATIVTPCPRDANGNCVSCP